MRSKYIWTLLMVFLISLPRACYKELTLLEPVNEENAPGIIAFDGVPAFEDHTDRMVLYTLSQDSMDSFTPIVEFGIYGDLTFNGVVLIPGEVNDLGAVRVNHPYELIAGNGSDIDTFKFMFTTIPLLRIFTETGIPYEPKLDSWLQLQYGVKNGDRDSTVLFESNAGIEIRGISANIFKKKSYGIELWENKFRVDRQAPLLGMRYGEDWILDAMGIDNLKMRNKLSFNVWNSMETKTPDEDRDRIKTGIGMEYVELFLNQRYNGLYCLGERMDEKVIDFGSSQDEKGGVMYKTYGYNEGSTTFRSYLVEPTTSPEWDGWEQIYPNEGLNWSPLSDLRKLVSLESDEIFIDQIGTQLDLENAANFYLLLNLIMGWDNVGKNVFLARYTEQSRLFFLPWDLEASWGRSWKMEDQNPWGIVGNGLHERLISLNAQGYKDSLSVMWENYRTSVFKEESLQQLVDSNYSILKKNGVIQRENKRWDLNLDLEAEYLYLSDWLEKRLLILDQHFSSLNL